MASFLIIVLISALFYTITCATSATLSNENILIHHICEDNRYIRIKWHYKKSWFIDTATLMFETGRVEQNETINEKSYSVEANSFFDNSLTVRELCKKDNNLRKADAYSKIENLFYAKLLLKELDTGFLELIENIVLHGFYDEVKGFEKDAHEDVVYDIAKSIFGFETPISDFISDCNATIEEGDHLSKETQKTGKMLIDYALFRIENINPNEGELEKRYRIIRDEAAASLIDLIVDVGISEFEQ